MDTPPLDNTKYQNNEPEYKKKLELSYLKCLSELCEPVPNWKELIEDSKFTMNPETGVPNKFYTFPLNFPDNITVESSHSYVFRRSHFYSMFLKKSSRIKRDLINHWKALGYYVNLWTENNKWNLTLSWR